MPVLPLDTASTFFIFSTAQSLKHPLFPLINALDKRTVYKLRFFLPRLYFDDAVHDTYKYFIITTHKAKGWKRGVTSINAINYALRGLAMNREEVIYYG